MDQIPSYGGDTGQGGEANINEFAGVAVGERAEWVKHAQGTPARPTFSDNIIIESASLLVGRMVIAMLVYRK